MVYRRDHEVPVEPWVVLLSGGLYVLSLVTPFAGRWPGLLFFVITFGTLFWFASPVLLVAASVLWKFPGIAFGLGLLASVLALLPALFGGLGEHLRLGYLFWLGSMVVFTASAGLILYARDTSPAQA